MTVEIHIEPFRDPRNVAGLIADVGEIVRPAMPAEPTDLVHAILGSLEHVRRFSRSPRTALKGAARSGHAELFRRVERASQCLETAWVDRYSWNGSLRPMCRYVTLADVSIRLVAAAMAARSAVVPRSTAPSHDQWTQAVYGSGIDASELQNIELAWRFKDITNRRHCGTSMRAAFEAAWLAKQYKFAKQLVGVKD